MQGRIYIPIWMNNQLVSWQGRWPEDLNWKAVSIPKYYNRPGPKGRMFYNNDTAMNWPFVVVVEGIPSVWRIGGPAVSMLGKSMTGPQRLLLQRWAGKPIIIMLDHDAFLESEGLLRELRTMVQSPVIEVRLPDNYDPGDYSHEADVAMICAAAAQQGIALSAW
jgi:DNA primase